MFASGKTAAVASAANYIEDVFSTYLYTGNDSTQTIANNIDISTKGALVWVKGRSGTYGVWDHTLITTPISNTVALSSNTTGNTFGLGASAFSPTTTGFNLNTASAALNNNGTNYASWTFRKQPKFFDVVTYTGNDVIGRQIPHNLGSVPGCIIVKQTNAAREWAVYHTSLGNTQYINLNSTGGAQTQTYWNNTSPTSTNFTVGDWGAVNGGGNTYVAYLFAHNAGGFGLTGTDNVISCGSYTGNGAAGGQLINLGYEAQWVMIKNSSSGGDWWMLDTMRGWFVNGDFGSDQALFANASSAESGQVAGQPDAQGFRPIQDNVNASGNTYIYIAIRRGPMKVPTSGTSVFSPNTANASAGTPVVTNFPVDLSISVATAGDTRYFSDRLRGVNSTGQTANQPWIASNSSGAELTNASIPRGWDNTQILVPPYYAGGPVVWWNMRRAPSFFDEVCYTGTGSNMTISHNLGVIPELMIVKMRSTATFTGYWYVYASSIGNTKYGLLSLTNSFSTSSGAWNNTTPTSSSFYVGTDFAVSESGKNFVAYLFATCAGVSKVGSYTGTGTTKQIDCGFAGGARFVLIKKTSGTGSWYVWDSARGIVSGNDPYLLLNSTAAEVTNTDYIDTYSAGFEISSTAPSEINENGGSFIFLAIS